MILTVIGVTSLIALSSADIQNQHQQPPKYAVSSHSFYRDDIPLSYKYSAVHVYTTNRPADMHQSIPNEENDQKQTYSIQYAPLHTKNNFKLTNQDRRKEHLEPRSTSERHLEGSMKQFIPGHNIEVLQTVNLNQGHNAVSRDSNQIFQHKKANYFQHYIMNNDNLTNSLTSTTQLPPKLYALLARQNLRSQLLGHDGLSGAENTKIPHPKAHRLHLNMARQYGVAQMLPFASNNILEPSNFQAQAHLLMYLPQPIKNEESIQKTILYPVQNKHKNFLPSA